MRRIIHYRQCKLRKTCSPATSRVILRYIPGKFAKLSKLFMQWRSTRACSCPTIVVERVRRAGQNQHEIISRLTAGGIPYIPGPGPRTLDLGEHGRAGIQICYEIVFSGRKIVRLCRRWNFACCTCLWLLEKTPTDTCSNFRGDLGRVRG